MRVSMRELKAHLSQYVVQAQTGQLIELTLHRKVVARIVGVPPTGNTAARVGRNKQRALRRMKLQFGAMRYAYCTLQQPFAIDGYWHSTDHR